MTVMVAIDPGYMRDDGRAHWHDRSAVAWFRDGALFLCGYWSDVRSMTLPEPNEVAIEKPTIHARSSYVGRAAVDPNRIVDLAWSGAMLAGWFRCKVSELLAQDWKLQMDKPVCHNHMLRALTSPERLCLPTGAEAKVAAAVRALGVTGTCPSYGWRGVDVLDAVSLGLVHLGRLNLGGRS